MFKRSMRFKPASLVALTAIKTSVASNTAAQSYSGAALNGTLVVANIAYPTLGEGAFSGIAGYPTVTTTASAAYTLNSQVVFTGLYGGVTTTRIATITSASAAATYIADGPLDSVSAIAVPAQAAGTGAFTFGFSGVAPSRKQGGGFRTWSVVATTAANLHCDAGGTTDTIPLAVGQQYLASPSRIYADSTAEFTLYEAD